MRKKFKSIVLFVMCVLMVMASMPVQVSAAKKNANHKAEYKRFDITVKGSTYYCHGARIRIFHDMKADHSFENSFVDLKGTVDVRLIRGKRGTIKTLELIPKDEANEILEDLFGYVPSRNKGTVGKNRITFFINLAPFKSSLIFNKKSLFIPCQKKKRTPSSSIRQLFFDIFIISILQTPFKHCMVLYSMLEFDYTIFIGKTVKKLKQEADFPWNFSFFDKTQKQDKLRSVNRSKNDRLSIIRQFKIQVIAKG